MAEEKAGEERSWPDGYDLHQDCSIRGSNLCWKFADSVGCSGCYLAAD